MSLRSRYQDRSIRAGQFVAAGTVLTLALFAVWIATKATPDQQIYSIACWWHLLHFDHQLIQYGGRAYESGWVIAAVSQQPQIIGRFWWWMAAILAAAGLVDVGVFWLVFWRKRTDESPDEHLRGARVVDAKTLKRELKK